MAGMGIFLLYMAFANHVKFIFLPAKLDARATLAYNAASKEFHEKYGLSTTALIGNLTPTNAQAMVEATKLMFTSTLYHQMREKLQLQVDRIKSEGVTLGFMPDKLEYEPNTGLTFVTGVQTITPLKGEPKEKIVTYEYRLIVDEYIPSISHFTFYDGGARTEYWISKNKPLLDKLIKEQEQEKKSENN